jgi:predicted ATPase
LKAAAVIGRSFDVGLLCHLTENTPSDILAALSAALSTQVVQLLPAASCAYEFRYQLVREVVYDDLLPHERCAFHLLTAQGLLLRRASGGDAAAGELAHHFLSAQPLGDAEVAVEYAQVAAAEALRLGAPEDALNLLQRALLGLSYSVSSEPELQAALLFQRAMVERVMSGSAELAGVDRRRRFTRKRVRASAKATTTTQPMRRSAELDS